MKKKTTLRASHKRESLPSWDLASNFYESIDDPEIENDILSVKATVKELVKYEGQLAKLLPYEVALFVKMYDGVTGLVRKLINYANLLSDTNLDDSEIANFKVSISERLEEITEPVGFLLSELSRIPEEQQYELLFNPKLRRYGPWLERLFFSADVNDQAMYIFNKKSATEYQWSKLYNEACARMEFEYQGKIYNDAQIRALKKAATSKDEEEAINQVMCKAYKQNAYIFTNCLNAIMKNEDVDAKLFGYYNAESESFDSNMVSREDLLLLVSAVTDAFIPMSRRFYSLLDKMHASDKCNSAGNPVIIPDKKYTWTECKNIVLSAYEEFSQIYAELAKNVINNNLIDVGTKKGKKSGAYCVSYDSSPYILLNFTGDESDINTFAHELGHAVHDLLSATHGQLNDNTPISLAEVASEFAENLVYEKQLATAKNDIQRLHLLIAHTEDQIGTIHRQVAIYNFEKRVHAERQKGSLTTERLNRIWAEEYERYTGEKLEGDSQYNWMCISHLFNSPFYVYCYAFAGCLVNNLIKVWHDNELENIELCSFQSRFMEMLSNTGVEPYSDLLEAFELDVNDPQFWRVGLESIEKNVNEIERLAKKEGLI